MMPASGFQLDSQVDSLLQSDSTRLVVGSLSSFGSLLDERRISRPLVVQSCEALKAAGASGSLESALEGVESTVFEAFTPNPRCEEAAHAARVAHENGCDGVVAIGGGSCMDVAKIAALAARSPDRIESLSRGEGVESADPLPILAAPTTSGSGSDATHFAAIYVDGRKVSVAHPGLRPLGVVLDVSLHVAMPSRLAAVTGLDALAQALESTWAVGATGRSIEFAASAGRLAFEHLARSVTDADETAREAMMIAAHLAGRAINVSKTTASHAMSYAMTEHHGLPHGLAAALTLGHVGAFNAQVDETSCQHQDGVATVRERVQLAASLLGVEPAGLPDVVRAVIASVGLPSSLSDAGIPRDAIASLARSVDPVRLGNNPRKLSHEDAERLLTDAFGEA